jgi:hypothetical protein
MPAHAVSEMASVPPSPPREMGFERVRRPFVSIPKRPGFGGLGLGIRHATDEIRAAINNMASKID